MAKKKTEKVESDNTPKRKTKKTSDAAKAAKPKRKRASKKKTDASKEEMVSESEPIKVDWKDALNPFKLSVINPDDKEEIELRAVFEMLSASENEECEFEVEEKISGKTSCEDEPWLNEIEARFEAIVCPIIGNYEHIDMVNIV